MRSHEQVAEDSGCVARGVSVGWSRVAAARQDCITRDERAEEEGDAEEESVGCHIVEGEVRDLSQGR